MKNEEGEDSPEKFQEEGMGSYFLSNSGESFTCFAIVTIIYIITIIAGKKFKFFKNLQQSFELNKFLEAIWTVYLNILISCFLQIQNIKSDGSAKDIFNLILCFICFLFFITCPIYFNYIILTNNLEENKQINKKYGSLWEGLQIKTSLGKSFNIILYYRKIYFSLVIVFLHDYTNIQIGLLCLHNFILANIIFLRRPALHSKENFKNFLSEVFLFVGETFIYQMHNMSENKDGTENEEKIIFGWVVITLLSMILLIHFISILHDVFIIVKTLITKWRNKKKLNQVFAEEKFIEVKKQKSNDQFDLQKISNFKVEVSNRDIFINSQLINSASGPNSLNIISDQQLQTKSTKEFQIVQNNLSKQNNKNQQPEESGDLTKMLQCNQRKRSQDSSLSQQVLENQKLQNIDEHFDIDSLKNMSISNGNINSYMSYQIPQSKSATEKIENITSLQRIMCNDQNTTQTQDNSRLKSIQMNQNYIKNNSNRQSLFTRGQKKKMTVHVEKVQKSLACIQNYEDDEESLRKNIDQSCYNNQSIINNQSISFSNQRPKIVINSIQPHSPHMLDQHQEDISSFANSMTSSRTNIVLLSPERIKKNRLLPFMDKIHKK